MNETGDLHLSPAEENRFDHLVDEGVMTPSEARAEILSDRQKTARDLAGRAITGSIAVPVPTDFHPEKTKPPRRSRRGGRAFPERHDWDEVPTHTEPMTGQQAFDFEVGIAELHAIGEAFQQQRDRQNGLSEDHVAALTRARREKRQRELH